MKNKFLFFISLNFLIFNLAFSDNTMDLYSALSIKSVPEKLLNDTWGEYKTDKFTGAFTYKYPIKTPPGVNALKPDITLTYNSQLVGSKPSVVGSGWAFNPSYIQRNIQYSRKDTSDDTYELYLNGVKYDLYLDGETFKVKRDESIKIIQEFGDLGWTVKFKNGVQYEFGISSSHILEIESSDSSVSYKWRWVLKTVTDANNNRIEYQYVKNPSAYDKGSIYLDYITYANDKVRIDFEYDLREHRRFYVDQGSETVLAQYLEGIIISDSGNQLKKYLLSYDFNSNNTRLLLKSIKEYNADITNALVTTFSYNVPDYSFSSPENWNTPGSTDIRETDRSNNYITDVIDMDGDGLLDLVKYDRFGGDDKWKVYENERDGFDETAQLWDVHPGDEGNHPLWQGSFTSENICNDSYNLFGDTFGLTADINHDGLSDHIVTEKTNSSEFDIWLNNGDGTWSANKKIAVPNYALNRLRDVKGLNESTCEVSFDAEQEFFDVNGDGYPDLVRAETDDDKVWVFRNLLGKGQESFDSREQWDTPYNLSGGFWLSRHDEDDKGQATFGKADVNADGLVDLIEITGSGDDWKVWFNTGSAFIEGWTQDMNLEHLNDLDSDGDVNRALMDINGDGLVDIVKGISNAREVRFNNGAGFSDWVTWTVAGGIAQDIRSVSTTIDSLSGKEQMHITNDMFDINGDGLPDIVEVDGSNWDVHFNESRYVDLMSSVVTPLGGSTNITYKTSRDHNSGKGLPFAINVVDELTQHNGMSGDYLVTGKKEYRYQTGEYDFTTREFRGFRYVYEELDNQIDIDYRFNQGEFDKGTEIRKTIADSVTNQTFKTIDKDWDADIDSVELDEEKETIFEGSQRHIRKKKFYYDAYSNLTLTINEGDINVIGDELYTENRYKWNRNSAWILDRKHTETIKYGSPPEIVKETKYYYDKDSHTVAPRKGNLTDIEIAVSNIGSVKTQFDHDSFGNIIEKINSNGAKTTFSYDIETNRFPEIETNFLISGNHVTEKEFDGYGNIISETNPSGAETVHEFDDFFRLEKVIKPGDTQSEPTKKFSYAINTNIPNHILTIKKHDGGYFKTFDFFDGFGRLVQKRQDYGESTDDLQVVTAYFYDNLGRIDKISNPVINSFTNQFQVNELDRNSLGMSYFRDVLNRVTKVTDQIGNQTVNDYIGWNIRVTDANDHWKSYEFDAYKKLSKLTEQSTNTPKITTYSYTPLGDLETIEDQSGNVWTYNYNELSDLTGFTDPDRGTHIFIRDGEGNLLSKTDSRGIQIDYEYDELNRIFKEDYPNDQDIEYIYDRETKGTLSEVSNELGTLKYFYDSRLRKNKEIQAMDGYEWETSFTYDSADNILSIIYPDNTTTNFTYNLASKINNITGIISSVNYSPHGLVSNLSYENGVNWSNEFDDTTLRLENIQSDFPNIGNNFERIYSYDSVGNINNITRNGVINTYGYDELNQLVSESIGNIIYKYDLLGNLEEFIKEGSTTAFNYNSNQPHQLSSVNGVPSILNLSLKNGGVLTSSQSVTFYLFASGQPTHYMMSESQNFANSSWNDFDNTILFNLSFGYGDKTIYVKTKNSAGVSDIYSATIRFDFIDTDGDGIPNDIDTDDDNDGMPDSWEDKYDLNSLDPNDAVLDTDGDGTTNLNEYLRGTNPLVAYSTEVVKRAEIPVPILRAIYGSEYIPPEATGSVFTDVQSGDFNADWIEKLANDGITEGCSETRFCPDLAVTKEQLAKILLKAKFGSSYTPSAPSGNLFDDVSTDTFAAGWIEGLVNQGITQGCDETNFCPKEGVTIESIEKMLEKALP